MLKKKKEVLGGKSVPFPHYSPQNSSTLTRDRSRAYEKKTSITLTKYIKIQLVLHEGHRVLPLATTIGEYYNRKQTLLIVNAQKHRVDKTRSS
jgi:hypothetical protein